MNCFYNEKHRFCSPLQAGNFCEFQLKGGYLQIKAFMEEANALGKHFDFLLHLKVASMLREEGEDFISLKIKRNNFGFFIPFLK